MPSFCAVLNCSNRAGKEKDKFSYRFLSNFQEIFKGQKARKNKSKNQKNAFCLSFIGFSTQNSQYAANTYSILTNSNRTSIAMSESSARISKFYDPTDFEHKFHETRIEYCLSIGFELGSPLQRTYSHNHFTMFSLQCDGESYISIFKALKQSWRPFTSLKLCKCSKNPHSVSKFIYQVDRTNIRD